MEDDCGEARHKLLLSLAGYHHGTTRVFQCVYFIHPEINENHIHPKQRNFLRIVLWFHGYHYINRGLAHCPSPGVASILNAPFRAC